MNIFNIYDKNFYINKTYMWGCSSSYEVYVSHNPTLKIISSI